MADNNNNNNNESVVIEDASTKHRGATGDFVDRLMEDAKKGGVKIVGKQDNNNGGAVDEPAKPTDDKKYDYGLFKNLDKDDYTGIDSYLKESKVENPAVRHRLASQLDDVKKQQKLATERDVRIKELEKAGVKEVEVDKKFAETITGLKSDFFGTYDKLQKEHKLPDISSIAQMLATGNTLQARVAQYQKDVLVSELEKKYKLEEGTFVFDAGEAWQSGTPSYEYRTKTADKENELRSEYQVKEKQISDTAKEMINLRNQHIKELKEMYFPVNVKDEKSEEYKQESESQDKKYTEMLGRFDSIYKLMGEGKPLSPEQNPFLFKNIFRGLFYDELSKIDILNAIQKVHGQYAKYGFTLPKDAMPEDVTKIKGESPEGDSGTFKVGDTKFSPQGRFLKRVEKEIK